MTAPPPASCILPPASCILPLASRYLKHSEDQVRRQQHAAIERRLGVTGQQPQAQRQPQPQRVAQAPVPHQHLAAPQPHRQPGEGEDHTGKKRHAGHQETAAFERQGPDQGGEIVQSHGPAPAVHPPTGQRHVQRRRPAQRHFGRQQQVEQIQRIESRRLIVSRQRRATANQRVPQRQVPTAPHLRRHALPGHKLQQWCPPEKSLAGEERSPQQEQRENDK